jgi:hypothetical protein
MVQPSDSQPRAWYFNKLIQLRSLSGTAYGGRLRPPWYNAPRTQGTPAPYIVDHSSQKPNSSGCLMATSWTRQRRLLLRQTPMPETPASIFVTSAAICSAVQDVSKSAAERADAVSVTLSSAPLITVLAHRVLELAMFSHHTAVQDTPVLNFWQDNEMCSSDTARWTSRKTLAFPFRAKSPRVVLLLTYRRQIFVGSSKVSLTGDQSCNRRTPCDVYHVAAIATVSSLGSVGEIMISYPLPP